MNSVGPQISNWTGLDYTHTGQYVTAQCEAQPQCLADLQARQLEKGEQKATRCATAPRLRLSPPTRTLSLGAPSALANCGVNQTNEKKLECVTFLFLFNS
ncbi:hypothetical protein RHMOL_Rhmol12G0046400 [Rhododendron molle]|uniref:Uncharacterized protein n=1 Tax=Rhododendron molle TaxID=49168 RepID=A0ACC0LEN8_RHOML|nr:hypothetical protein RHMOL_Rhmol12G0046400 [Rhododendron molle]